MAFFSSQESYRTLIRPWQLCQVSIVRCRWIGQMNKSKVLFWVKKDLVCAYAWNLIRTTTRLDIICIWSNFHLTIQWRPGHFTSGRVHLDLLERESKNSQSKEACIIDLGSLLLLLYYLRSKSTIRNVEEKYLREGIWIRYLLIIALFIAQWRASKRFWKYWRKV